MLIVRCGKLANQNIFDFPIASQKFFDIVALPNTESAMPHSAQNLIAAAHAVMCAKLAAITPSRITINPEPDEFEATAEYIHAVCRVMDEWILRVGQEVQSNASVRIDIDQFRGTFTDAVEGQAIFECEREAETLREDRAA